MKPNFKIIEVPKSGRDNWYYGAYTYAFVYSNKGNFLVKGYLKEVRDYIDRHFDRFFVRFTLYHAGLSRNILEFGKKCRLYVSDPVLKKRGYTPRYVVEPAYYEHNKNAIRLKFKRFPNKWIPEFDYLIDKFSKFEPEKDKDYGM